jgi:hypothetical protein
MTIFKPFIFLLLLQGCLENDPKAEMKEICELAEDASIKNISDPTERQLEFSRQTLTLMKTTEVTNIFQAIDSSAPEEKKRILKSGLKELGVDQASCQELLAFYP